MQWILSRKENAHLSFCSFYSVEINNQSINGTNGCTITYITLHDPFISFNPHLLTTSFITWSASSILLLVLFRVNSPLAKLVVEESTGRRICFTDGSKGLSAAQRAPCISYQLLPHWSFICPDWHCERSALTPQAAWWPDSPRPKSSKASPWNEQQLITNPPHLRWW